MLRVRYSKQCQRNALKDLRRAGVVDWLKDKVKSSVKGHILDFKFGGDELNYTLGQLAAKVASTRYKKYIERNSL